MAMHRGLTLASRGPPSYAASSSSSCSPSSPYQQLSRRPSLRFRCFSPQMDAMASVGSHGEYRPSFVDDLLLTYFRSKMVEEVGWDSEKPGYDGLMEVAKRPMLKGMSALETEQAGVRVLQSLFPPLSLALYKTLVSPIANGQLAAMMIARATALSCQWLMGPCSVNSITLPDGNSWSSGVFVKKCKYLEESKCLGICINTCKLPTQTFFKDHLGVDLYMEPNFEDYSCQFNYGVPPPPLDTDKALKEPCLDICANAKRRTELGRSRSPDDLSCSQV